MNSKGLYSTLIVIYCQHARKMAFHQDELKMQEKVFSFSYLTKVLARRFIDYLLFNK
jgi:hypothetical protein